MRYVVHFGPETMHIELEGDLTFMDERLFHKMLMALADCQGRYEIKLHLKRVSFVDATGLRLLMMLHDAAKRLRCSLCFLAPQGQVGEALARAALCNHLNIAA